MATLAHTHSVPDSTPVSCVREVHPNEAFVRVTSAPYQKQPKEVTENHAEVPDFKWSSKHKHTHHPHSSAGYGHCETVWHAWCTPGMSPEFT